MATSCFNLGTFLSTSSSMQVPSSTGNTWPILANSLACSCSTSSAYAPSWPRWPNCNSTSWRVPVSALGVLWASPAPSSQSSSLLLPLLPSLVLWAPTTSSSRPSVFWRHTQPATSSALTLPTKPDGGSISDCLPLPLCSG